MMLRDWTQALIEVYQEDLQDYEELLAEMNSYDTFLAEGRKALEEHEEIAEADSFEQRVTEFSDFRERKYQGLKERAVKTQALKKLISDQVGLPFDLPRLQPYIEEVLYQQLEQLTEMVTKKMAEVLALDALIIPKLKMELEKVKLEIHRLQGGKTTKKAYGNPLQTEARFIDKTK